MIKPQVDYAPELTAIKVNLAKTESDLHKRIDELSHLKAEFATVAKSESEQVKKEL
jgi:hypothetical protein